MKPYKLGKGLPDEVRHAEIAAVYDEIFFSRLENEGVFPASGYPQYSAELPPEITNFKLPSGKDKKAKAIDTYEEMLDRNEDVVFPHVKSQTRELPKKITYIPSVPSVPQKGMTLGDMLITKVSQYLHL